MRRRTSPKLDSLEIAWTYSIVHRDTLEALPIAAEVLEAIRAATTTGTKTTVEWRLSTAEHLIQLEPVKGSRPSQALARRISAKLAKADRVLQGSNAMLLPTGAHPLLRAVDARPTIGAGDPFELLPESSFDRHVHGHINSPTLRVGMPFEGDEEFTKLHAAVRVLLPIIPALTASSPFLEGRLTGYKGSRALSMVEAYRSHPSLLGSVVPEAVFLQEDYDRIVLTPIALAFAQRSEGADPDPEALNARAAVAFFDRGVLELRVMEPQEHPAMDLALVEFVRVVLKAMMTGRWVSSYLQRAWTEQDLEAVYMDVIKDAGITLFPNREYLMMFGLLNQDEMTAGMFWQHLFVKVYEDLSDEARTLVGHILEHGCLARRILQSAGPDASEQDIKRVYSELAQCLVQGRNFQ